MVFFLYAGVLGWLTATSENDGRWLLSGAAAITTCLAICVAIRATLLPGPTLIEWVLRGTAFTIFCASRGQKAGYAGLALVPSETFLRIL